MVKKCSKCGETKEEVLFSKDNRSMSGLQSSCKECYRIYCLMNKEKSSLCLKRYRKTEKGKAVLKAKAGRFRKSEKGKSSYRVYSLRYKANYPEKVAAHQAVSNALFSGKLLRQPCMRCGEKAEAHHPDYSKPLDVVWLCADHHREEHKKLNERNPNE